jgi:hypothetical protein
MAISFPVLTSPIQHASKGYWSFIMIMQKREFIEMLINIFWGNMIIN